MANTCYNYLTIGNNKNEDIIQYILNDDNIVDYDILIPMPDDVTLLNNPEQDRSYRGERDWAWVNVGTPGITESTDIEVLEDGSRYITFESQWSPPKKWFKVLCEKVVELDTNVNDPIAMELEYAEYDMGFGGKLDYTREVVNDCNVIETIYQGEQLDDLLGLPDPAFHL